MKTIYLALALFVPSIATAQEHLIKKTREQVRTIQQETKSPLVYGRTGKMFIDNYDHFHSANGPDLFCYYKGDTCLRVTAERNISAIDSLRRELDLSAVKVKKNVWINKEATVKIKLTTYRRLKKFDLIYSPTDKD